ncbi:MAG: endonuclease/exonuclease/phosphatase family protein [Bacteroidaceae bacterium]|nr:endonuclease/exonuclease/phosphatase family protein [Bacteroidaceae bacterium]
MAQKKTSNGAFSAVKQLLATLFLGANLVTLFLLWICCASTWVDPSMHPRMSVVGLVFPVFLFLNVAFLLLWLIYKPRMMVVPLVGMALCGNYILDYFPLNLGGKDKAHDLRIMTWNAGYFNGLPSDSFLLGLDYIMSCRADIVCLQEAQPSPYLMRTLEERVTGEGGYFEREGTRVLISRFPVVDKGTIEAESKSKYGNNTRYYHLLMDGDTVTLLNAHLECYNLSADEKDEYGDVLHSRDRDKMKSEVKYLTGRLAYSSRYRALQVKAIAQFLDNLPKGRRVLLCGDFNDTPISYAYQQIDKRLENAYRGGGFGVGLSFREKNFPVRIDHIFHSQEWECVSARIDRSTDISDHYPVIADLKNWQK